MGDAPTMDRLLRLDEVSQVTGLSTTTIYDWQAAGRFPRSIVLGARCTRWSQAEVQAWLERRKAENRSTLRAASPVPEVAASAEAPPPPRGRGRPRRVA